MTISLRGVPLFAHLDDDALASLEARCTTRAHAKGEVLWHAGDLGDEMLVVETGELEVLAPDGAGGNQVVARIGPGECAGELALLLDDRRSATVVCGVPTRVVALTKDAFGDVVRDRRSFALLNEMISRRAVALMQRRPVARRLLVVGVIADRGTPGASLVARSIVALATEEVGRRAVLVLPGDDDLDAVVAGVRTESADQHVAVLDLEPDHGVDAARALCDVVVRVVAGPEVHDDANVLTVVNRHGATGDGPPVNGCSPFVLPDEPALSGLRGDEAVAALLADARLAIRRPLGRLTRKLFGVTVGIALGGGAAFGIAHIGVLQALEDAGIAVDVFAGTSFGSIVAIGAASGMSGDDLAEIARTRGNVRTTLSVLDPAVDGSGLLAGRRLVRIFAPMISAERFEDLTRPCRVVATDIESGERVDIGTGRLDDAFRASCSIPLIFSPVAVDGRTLVDGAMVDPVPAEVVREMGADIVIAVNVVPRLERGSTTAISRLFKQVSRLNPLSYRRGARGLPDVVDVLMNSLQVVQYELGSFRALAGDVQVNVDLAGFTWIEFYRATEIVDRGRTAGEAAVEQVRAAVAARLD